MNLNFQTLERFNSDMRTSFSQLFVFLILNVIWKSNLKIDLWTILIKKKHVIYLQCSLDLTQYNWWCNYEILTASKNQFTTWSDIPYKTHLAMICMEYSSNKRYANFIASSIWNYSAHTTHNFCTRSVSLHK